MNGTNRQNLYFIDGPGGTGKTYLYNVIINYCVLNNILYLPIAFTGIAASLLKNGRTVHSQFRIPFDFDDKSTCNVPTQSPLATFIRNARIIIWDEISLCRKRIVEMVDLKCREIMNDNRPFGGKIVIVGGDFGQCLPILPGADAMQIVRECVQYAWDNLWWEFQSIKLMQNENDLEFKNWLLKIGENRITDLPGTAYYRNYVKCRLNA